MGTETILGKGKQPDPAPDLARILDVVNMEKFSKDIADRVIENLAANNAMIRRMIAQQNEDAARVGEQQNSAEW